VRRRVAGGCVVSASVAPSLLIGALLGLLAAALCFALRRLKRACDDFASSEPKAKRAVPAAPKPRRYASEVIDPRRQKRGACGVFGCPNVRPHSHVEDLIRRLKEPRQ